MVPEESDMDQQQAGEVNNPELSVIIPVYNGHSTLERLYMDLCQVLNDMGVQWELILVDDQSLDQSWLIIQRIVSSNSRVRGIRLLQNYGQHAATVCGISVCRGSYVITMDDDRENNPAAIPLMWSRRDTWDAIFVLLPPPPQVWWKGLGSRLIHFILRRRFSIRDRSFPFGSFRLLSPRIVKHLQTIQTGGIYFNAEVLMTASHPGYIIFGDRNNNKASRYTLRRTIKMATNLLWGYTAWPRMVTVFITIGLLALIPFCLLADSSYYIVLVWILLAIAQIYLVLNYFKWAHIKKQLLYQIIEFAGE